MSNQAPSGQSFQLAPKQHYEHTAEVIPKTPTKGKKEIEANKQTKYSQKHPENVNKE